MLWGGRAITLFYRSTRGISSSGLGRQLSTWFVLLSPRSLFITAKAIRDLPQVLGLRQGKSIEQQRGMAKQISGCSGSYLTKWASNRN